MPEQNESFLERIGDVNWRRSQIPDDKEEEYLKYLELGLLIYEDKLSKPIDWHSDFGNPKDPWRGAAKKFLKWFKEIPDHWIKEPLTLQKTPCASNLQELFQNHGAWVMSLLLGKKAYQVCLHADLKYKDVEKLHKNSCTEKTIDTLSLSCALEKLYLVQKKLIEQSCHTMALLWRDDVDSWLSPLLDFALAESPICPIHFQHLQTSISSLPLAYRELAQSKKNSNNIKKSRLTALATWRYLVIYLDLILPEEVKQTLFSTCPDQDPFWNGSDRLPNSIKQKLLLVMEDIFQKHPLAKYREDASDLEKVLTIPLILSPMFNRIKLLWKKLGLGQPPNSQDKDGWEMLKKHETFLEEVLKSMKKQKTKDISFCKDNLLSQENLIDFVEESLPRDLMEAIDRALFISQDSSVRHFVHRMQIEHKVDVKNPWRLQAFSEAFCHNPDSIPFVDIQTEKVDELLYISTPQLEDEFLDISSFPGENAPNKRREVALEQKHPISVHINSTSPGFIFVFWEDTKGTMTSTPPQWVECLSDWQLLTEQGNPVILEEGEFWARLYIVVFSHKFEAGAKQSDISECFISLMNKVAQESDAWVHRFILLGYE